MDFTFNAGPAVSVGGGGGGSFYDGLTPTIYAAPSAVGSGNGSSEANATTLVSALASATAGAIIGCLPGVYSRSIASGDHWEPIYTPANSGSSGNPITIVGKYDALVNYADTNLRCEFRNATADTASPWNGSGNYPVMGSYGRDYHTWINFYIDTSLVPAYPDRGTVVCNDAHNIKFRKIVFNRQLEYNGLDNYDEFFCQASDNLTIEYCYAYGAPGTTAHRNMAVIKTYSCNNFTFQYNTFDNVTQGIYIKGDVLGGGQSGTIRYNKSTGAEAGFIAVGVVRSGSAPTNTVTVHHNLSIRDAEGIRYESSGDSGSTNEGRKFYNNTVVDCTGAIGGSAIFANDASFNADELYNNVVAFLSSTAQHCVNFESGGHSGISPLDYNLYFESGATATFANNGSTYTGIAAWRTQTSKETNSSETNPSFVNAGADNYRRTGSGDTGSSTGGVRGCFETGSEQIGAF